MRALNVSTTANRKTSSVSSQRKSKRLSNTLENRSPPKRTVLDAAESAKTVSGYVPIAKSIVAKTDSEAAKFAKKTGYPIMLKLLSPKLIHKTEFGAVQKADNEQDLAKKFSSLIKKAKQKRIPVQGIMVQEFIKGTELILGVKKDKTFGHTVLVGIGGVMVELYKDVSFRVCPITAKDAESILEDLKGKQLLKGFRGKKPVSKKAIINALLGLCRLCKNKPQITELDINPFIVNDKKGIAADVRIVLE